MEDNKSIQEMLFFYKEHDKKMFDFILIFLGISLAYYLVKNWNKFFVSERKL